VAWFTNNQLHVIGWTIVPFCLTIARCTKKEREKVKTVQFMANFFSPLSFHALIARLRLDFSADREVNP
jgi:hypothetical protein